MPVRVIGTKDKVDFDPRNEPTHINTTSRSHNWSKGLSPFFVGPISLWGGYSAKNMENAWQYSKVYAGHTDDNDNPSPKWYEWANKGWADPIAHRYPMPKGVLPKYSYWNGEKLSYVEARKKIYLPLYGNAVRKTEAYHNLHAEYVMHGELTLWDFDGYDHRRLNFSYLDVLNNQNRKMGHAFVLAMLLEGQFDEILNEIQKPIS